MKYERQMDLEVFFRDLDIFLSAAESSERQRYLSYLKRRLSFFTSNDHALTQSQVNAYATAIRKLRNSIVDEKKRPTDYFALGFLMATLRRLKSEEHGSPLPPLNAEYVLYLLLRKDERDAVLGDLQETYAQVVKRFGKRRADIWFYKQVMGSLFPLVRRALLRVGALVWLGRILRRLIS